MYARVYSGTTRWQFNMDDGRPFFVNIWDFGGQEIYKATHQFFLTKRSLYALVADNRREDTDFNYWLNVVQLQSDNSPLLIIHNQKQQRRRDIPERELRGRFDNLKEIFRTNLITGDGLDDILRAIPFFMQQLPHVGDALPKTWVAIRTTLEQDDRNHIPYAEYQRICDEHNLTDPARQAQVIDYLHDLGVCLHFNDDIILRETVILKPEWGTEAVYAVLDNPGVMQNSGRFTTAELLQIWDDPKYQGMAAQLLRLMINFKLCYQIPGTTDAYIAPQLLSFDHEPYEWDEANNLQFRYRYGFMPKGLVTRLIVAVNQMIKGDLVWRTGVVLQRGDTVAEVIERYDIREIHIRLQGDDKQGLLAIIMKELEVIHTAFRRRPDVQMLVPCHCDECCNSAQPYFHPYKFLISMRQKQTPAQCQKSGTSVDPHALLNDVVPPKIRDDFEHHDKPIGNTTINIHGNVHGDLYGGNPVTEQEREPKLNINLDWVGKLYFPMIFVIVIIGLGVLAANVPPAALLVVIIAAIIFVPLIGTLQLFNEGKLTQKNFIELIRLLIGKIPVIGSSPNDDDNPPKGP